MHKRRQRREGGNSVSVFFILRIVWSIASSADLGVFQVWKLDWGFDNDAPGVVE